MTISGSLTKEIRDGSIPAIRFYADGIVNHIFTAYMMGYGYAKCLSNIGDL
jgi:hypothetical protein